MVTPRTHSLESVLRAIVPVLVFVLVPFSIACRSEAPIKAASVPSLGHPVLVLRNPASCMATTDVVAPGIKKTYLIPPDDSLRIPLPQGRWVIRWKSCEGTGEMIASLDRGHRYFILLSTRK